MKTTNAATARKLATAKPILSARRSFGWEWASRLPRDGAAAEAIYSALRAGYLALPARPDIVDSHRRETTAEGFDALVSRVTEDQTRAWGGARSFDRLRPAQLRVLMAAMAVKEDADLDSDAFHVIDAATGVYPG